LQIFIYCARLLESRTPPSGGGYLGSNPSSAAVSTNRH